MRHGRNFLFLMQTTLEFDVLVIEVHRARNDCMDRHKMSLTVRQIDVNLCHIISPLTHLSTELECSYVLNSEPDDFEDNSSNRKFS